MKFFGFATFALLIAAAAARSLESFESLEQVADFEPVELDSNEMALVQPYLDNGDVPNELFGEWVEEPEFDGEDEEVLPFDDLAF